MKETDEIYNEAMKERYRGKSHVRIILRSTSLVYTFLDNEIASVTKTNDVDPLTRRLPKEELSFSIYDYLGNYNPTNPEGRWHALDENASVTVEFGLEVGDSTKWLPMDVYMLSGRPSFASGIATFKAASKLCSLTGTYYKGTFERKSFYDLAVDVLTDAGITEYSISEELQELYTDAALPVTSFINCLQLIAHATCSTLRTVGGVITIEPFDYTENSEDYILRLDAIAFNGDVISKIDTLYKVESDLYTYTEEETESVIYEADIDVEEESNCHITYNLSTNQSVEASGSAVISDTHFYGSAADFKITGTGTFHVVVKGQKVNQSVTKSEVVISSNINGSTDSEKNQMITDFGMQSALIYHAANYLQFRITHSVKFRGAPELEPLDSIYFETVYGPFITALVLTHTVSYNGAISGTLTLKSLTEVSDNFLYDNTEIKVKDSLSEDVGIIGTEDYVSEYSVDEMDEFITEVNSGQTNTYDS